MARKYSYNPDSEVICRLCRAVHHIGSGSYIKVNGSIELGGIEIIGSNTVALPLSILRAPTRELTDAETVDLSNSTVWCLECFQIALNDRLPPTAQYKPQAK